MKKAQIIVTEGRPSGKTVFTINLTGKKVNCFGR